MYLLYLHFALGGSFSISLEKVMAEIDQEPFMEIVHKSLNVPPGNISKELLILSSRGPLVCFSAIMLWTLKKLKTSVQTD